MCCPDQSSYELAHRASLLDGNRTRGGLCPRLPCGGAVSRRDGGSFAEGGSVVTLRDEAAVRNQNGAPAGQFMVAVCQPGAIGTCAPGRPSVNCPNKKC